MISGLTTIANNKIKPLVKGIFLAGAYLSLPSAWADIQPRSASLNYSQKALSNAGNPAAAALIVERKDLHVMTGGAIEIGAGLEYGDLDELFELINDFAREHRPPDDGDDGTDRPPTPENPIRDYTWEDLFQEYPELEDRLDIIKDKVVDAAAITALIAAEGYGKAELTSNASFVLNEDLYGGTLMMGLAFKGNAKTVGLFDVINFDSEQAKAALRTIPDYGPEDPVQELDLSGGITLYYNPANQKIKFTIENDSFLLVKATKIAQISMSYSKKAFEFDQGSLYWGVKPSFYRVGLTNLNARLGQVTDAEALFQDIKDSEFIYKNGYDFDLGLVWAAPHYQLGASLTNVIEHTYKYPELDRTNVKSVDILKKLNFHEEFTMQRQVKLEAGIYTADRSWSLHAELDANPVEDPMRDRYQWFTLTAGYAADSWWLPSARFGMSRNLAGTKLGYLNAGITFMKFINLDVATTLDQVHLDGKEMMRGASIRLGVQFDY